MHKLIFITGCSTGIGLDALKTLKERGYNVLGSCRNSEDVQTLQDQGYSCIQLDLASASSIQEAVLQLSEYGELFALINNGAFGVPGAVEDLSREALRHQFETNVFGTHELTRACLKLMLKNNTGRIIQISSILGGLCLPFRGAYNASKYALEGLSDTMRLELASTNI
ncbi:MAG: SDR family NAD(P)-dependent oxidoreductase, partial [Mycoplasmataceae bacterium]|nr:SDR family NAD(P)-dependent oxidoreductase [Mycoplasmataceae bacterium]